MSKENILEEFEKSVFGDCFAGGTFVDNEKQEMYTSGFKEGFNKAKNMSKQFISQAIDQTRKETIREVEEMVGEITPSYDGEALDTNNNLRWYDQGFGEYKEEIRQSLKSLINK